MSKHQLLNTTQLARRESVLAALRSKPDGMDMFALGAALGTDPKQAAQLAANLQFALAASGSPERIRVSGARGERVWTLKPATKHHRP